MSMRILFVIHIGETLGHFIRGISIVDELKKCDINVDIACSDKIKAYPTVDLREYNLRTLRWNWSHNSCEPTGPSGHFLTKILETAEDLLNLVNRIRPDAIIGMPGFATAQLARHLGIPHFCILHGPYLAPITRLVKASDTENRVIERAVAMCAGPLNAGFQALQHKFGLPPLAYDEFLHTETIFSPQPGVVLTGKFPNISFTSFVRGSLGPPMETSSDFHDSCYVTFGSGNPCNMQHVIDLVAQVYEHVIVSTGRTEFSSSNKQVIARPYNADSSLAGQVNAVVCHGGIGTVGTFAGSGTPLLIIPTELDQAVMAVHATRMKIAAECGLDSVAQRTASGRRLPEFSDDQFVEALSHLKRIPSYEPFLDNGAEQIAHSVKLRLSSANISHSAAVGD